MVRCWTKKNWKKLTHQSGLFGLGSFNEEKRTAIYVLAKGKNPLGITWWAFLNKAIPEITKVSKHLTKTFIRFFIRSNI